MSYNIHRLDFMPRLNAKYKKIKGRAKYSVQWWKETPTFKRIDRWLKLDRRMEMNYYMHINGHKG